MGCDIGSITPDTTYKGSIASVCPGLPAGQNPPSHDGTTITSGTRTDNELTNPANFDGSGGFTLGDGDNPLWRLSGQPQGITILQDGTIAGALSENITADTDYTVTVEYRTDNGTAYGIPFTWTVIQTNVAPPLVGAFSIGDPVNTLTATSLTATFQNADRYILQDTPTQPAWDDPSEDVATFNNDTILLTDYLVQETWYIFAISTSEMLISVADSDTVTAQDTNPPDTVTDFAVVAGSDPQTQITCSWSAATDAESGVARVDIVNYGFTVIKSNASSPQPVGGLTPGQTYNLSLAVYDNAGNVSYSNVVPYTTNAGASNLFTPNYTDWQTDGSWVADGDVAGTYSGTAMANGSDLYQDVNTLSSGSLIAGNTYRLEVYINSISAGWLTPKVGGNSGSAFTQPGWNQQDILLPLGNTIFPFTGVASSGTATANVQVTDAGTGNGMRLTDLGVV